MLLQGEKKNLRRLCVEICKNRNFGLFYPLNMLFFAQNVIIL